MTNYLDFNFKLLHHPEHLVAIKQGIPVFPVHATVSLSNVCNHKCLWCTAYESQKEQYTILSASNLLHFLERAARKGLKAVTYVGNGEPTTYPNFGKLVTDLSIIGLEQGMFTNGYLLNQLTLEQIFHFTWIRISLDAGSTTVHDSIHGISGHFDTIIGNIKRILSARKEIFPTVGVQYAVHQKNLNDLYTCARQMKELGVNYFSIKPVFNRGSVGQRIEENTLTLDSLLPIVECIKNDFESDNFLIFFRPQQILNHEQGHATIPYSLCGAGFFNISINEDGQIIYCGPHKTAIGKISDSTSTIEKEILKISATLDLRKCPPGCRYHPLNQLLHTIINPSLNSKSSHIRFI